ncbi:MAG TPA: hypothetical protein VG963_12270 [Polyangiaceae bacterium]|nr:hypothetical protein [Polyangiaceae bacterium]
MRSLVRAPRTPASDVPRQVRRSLLYVDNAPSRIAWMRGVAERAGVDLITASTGESGIELARCRQPDLIIVDLGLLRANAAEVIRNLRESRETYRIPVMGFSSRACASIPGLSLYCRRPIARSEFHALLRTLLGRSSHDRRGAFSSV